MLQAPTTLSRYTVKPLYTRPEPHIQNYCLVQRGYWLKVVIYVGISRLQPQTIYCIRGDSCLDHVSVQSVLNIAQPCILSTIKLTSSDYNFANFAKFGMYMQYYTNYYIYIFFVVVLFLFGESLVQRGFTVYTKEI